MKFPWLKFIVQSIITMLAVIYFAIFGLTFAVYIVIGVGNPKIDTVQYTSAAFALLAGVSSLCFSWSKAIDQENYSNEVKKLANLGANSMISAMLFLVGSFIKFLFFHSTYYHSNLSKLTIWDGSLLGSVIPVSLAGILTIFTIYRIFEIYVKKLSWLSKFYN